MTPDKIRGLCAECSYKFPVAEGFDSDDREEMINEMYELCLQVREEALTDAMNACDDEIKSPRGKK